MTKEGSAKRPGDVSEVGRERLALLLAGGLVGAAQDRRRVDRGRDDRRELGLEQLAALARYAEARAEDRLGRRGAEQDQSLGGDHAQLLLEPRLAGVDLEPLRRGVDPAAAALLELEVLHNVGHVGLRAVDAGGLEPPVELAPGRS